MNENINLCEILKDCPKGTKLYSTFFGDVEFAGIYRDEVYAIRITINRNGNNVCTWLTADGRYSAECDGECALFPSKEQRDWSKFTAPWYKKEKFDPNTLQPFDKVLVRTEWYNLWSIDLFSFIGNKDFKCIGGYFKICIPYNEETKHLVGTLGEAPEYYRYWED